MRKTIALLVSVAFLLGTTGLAVAQTSTPAPAPAEKKADDKTMDKKTMDKTMEKKPAKKAMTTEEKKAACLQKAGTDEAKKATCEKRFAAKGEKGGEKTDKKGAMKEEEKKK